MKEDGRDLLAEFRAMAPERRPIAVQRWSVRRVVLILATLAVLFLSALTGVALLFPSRGTVTTPVCGTGRAMQLMAQAVPTATRLPCVSSLPYGWGVGSAETVGGQANFTVGVGDGFDPVTISLTEYCPAPVGGTEQIPIEGGCVTYRSTVTGPYVASFAPNGGLAFTPRADLVTAVASDDDQVLCGALAPACR